MQKNANSHIFRLTWNIGKSVGPFKFGTKVESCSWALEGDPRPVSALLSEVSHRIKGHRDAYVYSDEGIISSVSSHSEFWVEDVNIIGCPMDQTIQKIGQNPDDSEIQCVIDDEQSVLYFYDLGLTLWAQDETIVTAQASPAF